MKIQGGGLGFRAFPVGGSFSLGFERDFQFFEFYTFIAFYLFLIKNFCFVLSLSPFF